MDREIKKLLKLSSVPGFRLSKQEEAKLEAWKNAQKALIVKKPRKRRVKNIITKEEKVNNGEAVSD